jgi:hypothetical protein
MSQEQNLEGNAEPFQLSSPEDSPAPKSRARAKARASVPKTTQLKCQGCGGRCGGSSKTSDPRGCLLKMYLLSELEGLTPFSVVWKNSGTPAGRSWWVLGRSGLHISETESGWWPTMYGSGNVDKTGKRGGACELAMAAKYPERMIGGRVRLNSPKKPKDWPTARAEDSEQTGGHRGKADTLTSAARLYTAPGGQQGPESPSTSGKTLGCLNPEWVAQLMGLPEGWLDVELPN